MGKVREKAGYVLVPNDSLRPEYLYSMEQSLQWDWEGKQQLTASVSAFASRLNDAIVPQNTTLDGEEFFLIDGDSARVQTNVNASHAHIGGIRAEIHAKLTPSWNVQGAVNWTAGHQFIPDASTGIKTKLPMSHIPPACSGGWRPTTKAGGGPSNVMCFSAASNPPIDLGHTRRTIWI